MVSTFMLKAVGDEAWMPAIRAHHPNRRRPSGLGSTEYNLFPLRRFAGAKIPNRRLVASEHAHGTILRVEFADLCSATGQLRFVVAIEVIRIGALWLKFPRDL